MPDVKHPVTTPHIGRWIALRTCIGAFVVMSVLASAVTVAAESTVSRGTVVRLRGSPHLWIADDDGVIHWAGDTRALIGRPIDWSKRREVDLVDLLQLPRGQPWLSSGLVKAGDPIYLVKWETTETAPTLLQIHSLADMQLFGISGDNYGEYVLDLATWEGRFGLSTIGLSRGSLPRATSGPITAPTLTDISEGTRELLEAELLRETNRDRTTAGLGPLDPDPELLAIARKRATDQRTHESLSHLDADGALAFLRLIQQAGIPHRVAGENLVRLSQGNPIETAATRAEDALRQSPTHRANLLDPRYGRVAIGMAHEASGRVTFAQIFRNAP